MLTPRHAATSSGSSTARSTACAAPREQTWFDLTAQSTRHKR